jgi:hypothetical protein
MAVSQGSRFIWSATGEASAGAATTNLTARTPIPDGEHKMANKPSTRITKEMQQIISEMIARMSLRG